MDFDFGKIVFIVIAIIGYTISTRRRPAKKNSTEESPNGDFENTLTELFEQFTGRDLEAEKLEEERLQREQQELVAAEQARAKAAAEARKRVSRRVVTTPKIEEVDSTEDSLFDDDLARAVVMSEILKRKF